MTAEPMEAQDVDRRVVVGGGLAASWSFGGAAGAWAPTLAERIELSGEVGHQKRAAVGFSLVHARPELARAGELIEGAPPDAVQGWRDELSILLTVRVPLEVLPPTALAVLPTFGFGAGVLATDAHLDTMGFVGRAPVRSRSLSPVLAGRLGLELRFRNWLSLLPHGELLATAAPDTAEEGPGELWDVEARVLAGADVVIRF